jgi:hypothetical protein
LQLWIQPNGTKLWRLAGRFGGKQKLLALGAYPTVTLAEDRDACADAKRELRKGADPSDAQGEPSRASRHEGHFQRPMQRTHRDAESSCCGDAA